MGENEMKNMDQILNASPCGLIKLAMDDELTILHAADNFYNLIEVDPSKHTKLPKSIFQTVYSADIIYYTQQIASQKRRKNNQFLLFYRTLPKNGSLKWIMLSGNKTEEEFQKQNKTYPTYLCVSLDITDHMRDYKKMEQELDYHRTILELSKELFYEYNIASDTLTFKELFREVFGKESEIKNFSQRLEKTKIIHPDDLPDVIKIYRNIMGGKKQARTEFRLRTKDGDIAWYICYASIIYDENKNPFRVVGKLTLMNTKDEEKKDIKIELDTLTNVYTKACAEEMIIDSMQSQNNKDISALFLCEVRNYKALNEVVKIIDGENVLTAIAGILKKHFRTTDIIGRMGLGDFVVYMKGIRSEKNAYEMADLICKEVSKLYPYEFNKSGVGLSIGVSLIKGQADFSKEMENAKVALVMAKNDNKSSFEFFYPSLSK
jgi:diguanylate cyclase (GGDEF)-like protein